MHEIEPQVKPFELRKQNLAGNISLLYISVVYYNDQYVQLKAREINDKLCSYMYGYTAKEIYCVFWGVNKGWCIFFVSNGMLLEHDFCKDNIDIDIFFFWLHKHAELIPLYKDGFIFHISTWLTMNKMADFSHISFKICSLERKFSILIKVTLRVVLHGPIDVIWALFQIIAWHLLGTKPLPEPLLVLIPEGPSVSSINPSLWPYSDLVWDSGALHWDQSEHYPQPFTC